MAARAERGVSARMGRARIEWRDGSPMEVTWIVFSVDELVITGVNVGAGCRRLTRAHCVVTRCHVDYVVTGAEGTARMLSAWSGKLQQEQERFGFERYSYLGGCSQICSGHQGYTLWSPCRTLSTVSSQWARFSWQCVKNWKRKF